MKETEVQTVQLHKVSVPVGEGKARVLLLFPRRILCLAHPKAPQCST